MTRRRVTSTAIVIAAVVASTLAGAVAGGDAAGAVGRHAKQLGKSDFPDPGFAKFGSYYYLYKTGGGFGERTSVSPASGYSPVARTMPARPKWVSASSPKLWAPHVFAVPDYKGKPLYVMYFTGQSASRKVHCLGVATSRTPDRNFKAKNRATLCATKSGYEAIDPSSYLAKDGKRYMLYKSDRGNVAGFAIQVIQMDTATGTKLANNKHIIKIHPKKGTVNQRRVEAPVAISHGGRVWLFTSRGNYADCTYYTDVWSAPTLWAGKFRHENTVMSSATTGLCGPGGATVLQDGYTTRIAFHAWVDGTPSSKKRAVWVGKLTWNSKGRPTLY